MYRTLARWLVALALLALSPAPALADAAPFCDAGQSPAFSFGFADLQSALGATMGDPTECEHPNSVNGDSLQQTTTGLAIYRQSTNTPEFTDGWNHWALTVRGVIAWSGADQPPVAAQRTPPQAAGPECVDVGAGLCMNAPPELADTVSLLATTTSARQLLRTAANSGYTVRYANLPPDVLGLFRPSRHEVALSNDLKAYSSVDRGPVLAHELQHVSDWISLGRQLDTQAGCLATESNAFHTESATWLELRNGRLSPPANDLEQEFNAITRAIESDPEAFASRLTLLYHDECSVQ